MKKKQVSKLQYVTARAEYPYKITMVTSFAKIAYYCDFLYENVET